MRIVVVGYGEMFKALILGVLRSEHELVGVFRYNNVLFNPIKRFFYDFLVPSDDYNFVKLHNLNDIKAKSVNSKKFIKKLKELNTDIVLVGSWGEKFSANTISVPKIGCINVHPSLLPKHRGPNPYLQAILHNEENTGITFHYMDTGYDTGTILHQVKIPIEKKDTGINLKHKCCNIANIEITKLINEFSKYEQNKFPQDELQASYEKRVSLKESILNFEKETAEEIDRRIRAFSSWLKCHIYCHGQFFTFSDYKICEEKSEKNSGCIIKKTKSSLYITCKDKQVMEFNNIKMVYPLSCIFTKFYMNKIIKTNDFAK